MSRFTNDSPQKSKTSDFQIENFDIKQLETFSVPIMLDLKFFDITSTVKEAILGYAKNINDKVTHSIMLFKDTGGASQHLKRNFQDRFFESITCA